MKTIDINGQQVDVVIERKRVKNINLRVREGKVFVSASKRVSQKYLLDFVKRNSDFIENALIKNKKKIRYSIADFEEKSEGTIYLFGEKFDYCYIIENKSDIEIQENKLIITAPDVKKAQKILEQFLKERLSEYIEKSNVKIYDVFRKYGIPSPTINYRKMKSRWGSCYYKDSKIFLNTALATAPKECIDYVLFHEYTHFLYPNHQKEFYDFLSKYIPQYKDIKKCLNTFDKY